MIRTTARHRTGTPRSAAPTPRFRLAVERLEDPDEVGRLQRSCHRHSYTMPDAEFGQRWEMAFDIMAVVCIDLRAMWAKLHVLEWVVGDARQIATGHHVTAGLAVVEGGRRAPGLRPTEFGAPPRPPPEAADDPSPPDADDAVVVHEDGGEEDDAADRLDLRLVLIRCAPGILGIFVLGKIG